MVLEVRDQFWDSRIQVTRNSTLPLLHRFYKESGRWDAFKLQWKHGDPNEPHLFWDSDVAKLVESLCYAIGHMNEDDHFYSIFMAWVDEAIKMIGDAQGDDGYINIYYTVVEPQKRWTDVAQTCELYNAGHLLEAAVAHYELTRKSHFLDIICKYVDYIDSIFGLERGKRHGYPGHQVLELALLKLYRLRPQQQNEKYLKLARYFIEQRGYNHGEFYDQEARARGVDPTKYIPTLPPNHNNTWWPKPQCYWYMQADEQIRGLREIRGHSVRAMYYLTGVQHLANLTGDETLDSAVDRMWRNMVDKKLYIHGGLGAIKMWEGFGDEYDLPLDCYAETCASVGILMLGRRMLENRLRGEVSNVMERALYNNVLGGISIDGKQFFYNQPLEKDGMKRSSWFTVVCCPPNVTRMLNQLEDYIFTKADKSIAINLFIGSVLQAEGIALTVKTTYPWQGSLSVEVFSDHPIELAIREPSEDFSCSLPHEKRDGYCIFETKKWNEIVEIQWSIAPKIVVGNPRVKAVQGKCAVERGPFVYVLEQMDSEVDVDKVVLNNSTKFTEQMSQISGLNVCTLHAVLNGENLKFIPYFCYGNRQPGNRMRVWFDEKT